jgi:hypothetical protein
MAATSGAEKFSPPALPAGPPRQDMVRKGCCRRFRLSSSGGGGRARVAALGERHTLSTRSLNCCRGATAGGGRRVRLGRVPVRRASCRNARPPHCAPAAGWSSARSTRRRVRNSGRRGSPCGSRVPSAVGPDPRALYIDVSPMRCVNTLLCSLLGGLPLICLCSCASVDRWAFGRFGDETLRDGALGAVCDSAALTAGI